MNNMFFLAVLLKLLIFPSISYSYESYSQFVDGVERFLNLKRINYVFDSSFCHSNTDMLAYYHSEQKYLSFCSNNMNNYSNSERIMVLKHELIHLAQDCKAGFNNNNLTAILPKHILLNAHDLMSDEIIRMIENSYPESNWVIELEAYVLQNFDNDFIMQILINECNYL